ncbi:hypothetical protein [Reichenbachiella ulvae]|uniref:Uncharacterized protein n=1 Tax=Reichenbachiella ulvae TaxID=2980104 RepID=A0ABT3CZ60_9BACT|nr:hypothetical protein [Reichenbachiella ulvae]MCV9388804.1 hypothetical protein [Reichenbachiella ulvae]
MKLTGKNILLISPEPWEHINVSKHHYARHLAQRGNQVVFANPASDHWELKDTDTEGLQELNYPKFLKGLRLLPAFISQRLILKKFNQIQNYCQLNFDIVWSFDNSVFFDFTCLPSFNINHIVDLNQDFETKKAASTADLCLGCSDLIINRLTQYQTNCHLIQHGFNDKTLTQEIKLPGQQITKALYAGNLDMPYLDWGIFHQIVTDNPTVDFILLGPWTGKSNAQNNTSSVIETVFAANNVHHLGPIAADDLPNYYAAADLLLILYQEEHHLDQANPHKMMEYLGTGKPIVATYTKMFDGLDERIIRMSKKNQGYPELFRQTVKQLSELSHAELCAKRSCLAMDNTYPKQIERIEKLIPS